MNNNAIYGDGYTRVLRIVRLDYTLAMCKFHGINCTQIILSPAPALQTGRNQRTPVMKSPIRRKAC